MGQDFVPGRVEKCAPEQDFVPWRRNDSLVAALKNSFLFQSAAPRPGTKSCSKRGCIDALGNRNLLPRPEQNFVGSADYLILMISKKTIPNHPLHGPQVLF